ncbi:MAG: chloride channel protein [Microcystaceae cyanobacterium]
MLSQRLKNWLNMRHFGRTAVDSRYALVEACLIGILSAIAALILKEGVGWLGGWRVQLANQYSPWLVLPLGGLIFGWLAGWLIQTISPTAARGGISQVKAALARFNVPLSGQVAIIKLASAILVIGAGLPLGRRAPTVHIGAALAAQLSNWLPTSPEHRRQMIAAGAAAGLAAGFTTPIAGVLFVVEELMRDISGLTLETAIVASFTGAVVSLFLSNYFDAATAQGMMQEFNTSFATDEIPFYLILGILAGVLGGFFNKGMIWAVKAHDRLNWPLSWRIGITASISGVIIAMLPDFFQDHAGLREFLVTGQLTPEQIVIVFITYFFLTLFAYSSGAPGGLFAPALMLGAALGYLVGDLEALISNTGTSTTFALAGMGAFFTSVVRVPVTAIVIIFELRADFDLVLPLMISCAVSYIVADSISKGSLYEHLLKNSGIQLTEENPLHDFLSDLTAADVMQSQVETLESDLPLDEVLQLMSFSNHRGFPVVKNGQLVGIFTQSDLKKRIRREMKPSALLQDVMVTPPITVQATDSLSDVLYLLNRFELSRLPVTENQQLVGIITRTDIIRIEANQLKGQSLPQKQDPSYTVYQTRSPAKGKGRILLPLSHSNSASALFKIASAIARQKDYEIECLQVIEIPKHSPTAQTYVDTREERKLMHRIERMGRHDKVPTHTQIRVGHDVTETILETLRERHITLLMMGWKGESRTQEAIFGNVVDTLIHKVSCDLMLIKLGKQSNSYPFTLSQQDSWLIPMAGGPNMEKAINLLPALARLYPAPQALKFWLCKVFPPSDSHPDATALKENAKKLENKMNCTVIALPIRSNSVSDALIQFTETEHCSLIVLGGTKESLLTQVIQGSIPNAIAQKVQSTVILFRGAL